MRLQPFVRSITGVDSSMGMLRVLEQKIADMGLTNVYAVFCDVEQGERPPGPYHLIVSSMTLHHVADLLPLFRLFHDLLLPGGTVALADLDRENGSFHDDPVGVLHQGFDRSELKRLLHQADFVDIADRTAAFIHKGKETSGRDYTVFLITAHKN